MFNINESAIRLEKYSLYKNYKNKIWINCSVLLLLIIKQIGINKNKY